MPRECLKIIESKSKVRQTRAKAVVAKTRRTKLLLPAPCSLSKQLTNLCYYLWWCPFSSEQSSHHADVYRDNISEYVSQAAAANYNQVSSNFRPQMVANHIRPPGFPPVQNSQANNANNFNRGNQL
ncbi:hypothetical protein Tco_1234916 [Tanacetum coccineum]